MQRVAHRRNTLDALAATPRHLGIEMDVRTHRGRVVVAHDPFEDGPDLGSWLDAYDHALLIVNVKAEGVEQLVLPELRARGIEDFFFLDVSMPALWKLVRAGESRVAVRVSELEPVAGARRLAGRCRWAWVDGFFGFSADAGMLEALAEDGYRTCLVSPELHGRPVDDIDGYRAHCEALGWTPDAVCTRHPERWV